MASPLTVLVVAWVTNQTHNIIVKRVQVDGLIQLDVELKDSWRVPDLPFAVLCWCITQVSCNFQC